MTSLVTGAAGFIGNALCLKLLATGEKVIGFDNLNDYYSPELKKLRLTSTQNYPNFSFYCDDLSNLTKLSEILRIHNIQNVYHLAAQAGVRIPLNKFTKYVESNLVGFSNVLQAVLENEIPNFLYASSSSIYGDSSQIPYVESEKNLKPNSFYGATKLSNEILTNSIINGSSTRARGMRFFTVYGPAGRPDMAYFRIINSLINETNFTLFGDGSIERDFTYIDDCVEMIIKLTEELSTHKSGFSDLVNIGGGHPVSMKKLIEIASGQLNKDLRITWSESNANDVEKTMADSAYLMKLIGVKPKCKLEDGIAKTIEWARSTVLPEKLASWVASSK